MASRMIGITTTLMVACACVGAPPAGLDYSGDCTRAGCHDGFAKLPVVHDPIESCDTCHEVEDEKAHRVTLTESGSELCAGCHDAFEGKVTHSPAAEGECLTCHAPHASRHAGLLRDNQPALCAECHEDGADGRSFLHGPVAAGQCTACHDPHASDHSNLLADESRAVCLGCHGAMKRRLADSGHVHAVAADSCTACHDPHGADNRMFTSETGPALCLSCHDDIGEAIEDAKVKHNAVSAGAACAGCHDPHASSFAGMLNSRQIGVCLSCHDKPIESPDGTLPNMKLLLAENPVQHGPIADGECALCHPAVHGGERLWLLGAAYPATFYAAYDAAKYELCFECHDEEAFAAAETDDATQFRNGTQNLHYLHVARATKGRTCGACHQVHASKSPHLLAQEVPFGQWQLPIGFHATENGGTCASGCHRVYRYDREEPVVNVPATDSAASDA